MTNEGLHLLSYYSRPQKKVFIAPSPPFSKGGWGGFRIPPSPLAYSAEVATKAGRERVGVRVQVLYLNPLTPDQVRGRL
jgi:hypothetical protein